MSICKKFYSFIFAPNENKRLYFLFLLTFLILSSSLRSSLTYTYYKLDPISFIENLCVNQDKPELQCNGKCHLKKVAQSQDKTKKTPESIIDFKELILFPCPKEMVSSSHNISEKKQISNAYKNLYTFIDTFDCFHPPKS